MKYSRPILLFCLAAFTALVYLPGLNGTFLLDDGANLDPVWRWLDGRIGWLQVVLENGSGPLGRPLAMLSFVGNALVSGQSAWGFKLVNLLIHLLCGLALYALLTLTFSRDHVLRAKARWVALAIAAVWLLHPMFASTVLYVVQRMAMLSALFMLLALWSFMRGRLDLEAGQSRRGAIWLFAGVPLFTVTAALSKETGLLVPLLCGVLELVYFVPNAGRARPMVARVFIYGFVVAPVVIGLIFLLTHSGYYTASYENRPFSLDERLLTQSRVLFDYVGSLLMPVGQKLSLYRDDYLVSTSLLSPITTLLSILGWLLVIATAYGLRRRIPGYSAGIGIFLAGHAMESSIFPLLIYFEHRNYLPAIGILMAVASLLVFAGKRVHVHMDRPGLVFGGAIGGLLIALSFATFARAIAWQSPMYLLEQSVRHYPDSRFVRMELAAQIMNSPLPDHQAALDHYRHLQELDLPSTRTIGYIGEIAVTCVATGQTDPDNLESAFATQPETIQADMLKAIEALGGILRRRDCEGASGRAFADRLVDMADRTHLPQGHRNVWRMRFEAARLYAEETRSRKALEQAELAWKTGRADLPVGMMIAGLHIRLEQFGSAQRVLDEVAPLIPKDDLAGQELLDEYRNAIEEAQSRSIFR